MEISRWLSLLALASFSSSFSSSSFVLDLVGLRRRRTQDEDDVVSHRHQACDVRHGYSEEQFLHRESQTEMSAPPAMIPVYGGKEAIMEYLIMLATVTMVALYALIIARSLPKT